MTGGSLQKLSSYLPENTGTGIPVKKLYVDPSLAQCISNQLLDSTKTLLWRLLSFPLPLICPYLWDEDFVATLLSPLVEKGISASLPLL